MTDIIDMRKAALVAAFIRDRAGQAVVLTTDVRQVSSAVRDVADVIVEVSADGIGTVIKDRGREPPPPPLDVYLGGWSYTGAVRLRPTIFGCVVEEQVQREDGTDKWVRVTSPYVIENGWRER